MKKFSILTLSAVMALTSFVPAQAFTVAVTTSNTQISNVEQVQYYRENRRRGWHNGHRGYNRYRRGYRRHSDGWWYPLAAFGAGAIIGGAIANEGRVRDGGDLNPRHVEWCYDRYRSYRAYDNSFAPYGGGRQQCYSPYY